MAWVLVGCGAIADETGGNETEKEAKDRIAKALLSAANSSSGQELSSGQVLSSGQNLSSSVNGQSVAGSSGASSQGLSSSVGGASSVGGFSSSAALSSSSVLSVPAKLDFKLMNNSGVVGGYKLYAVDYGDGTESSEVTDSVGSCLNKAPGCTFSWAEAHNANGLYLFLVNSAFSKLSSWGESVAGFAFDNSAASGTATTLGLTNTDTLRISARIPAGVKMIVRLDGPTVFTANSGDDYPRAPIVGTGLLTTYKLALSSFNKQSWALGKTWAVSGVSAVQIVQEYIAKRQGEPFPSSPISNSIGVAYITW